jgi:energy-coupling factor transporter ATP-binding protein EcfA2
MQAGHPESQVRRYVRLFVLAKANHWIETMSDLPRLPDLDSGDDDGPRSAAANTDLAPVPPAIAAMPDPIAQAPGRAVIIGPSGSGKTNLLLAMHQACHCEKPGDPELDFVHENSAMAELIQHSIHMMLDDAVLRSSTGPLRYDFSVAVRDGKEPEQHLSVQIHDGLGGALFPGEAQGPIEQTEVQKWQDAMIQAARQADSLVLCVESIRSPRLLFLHLPLLIQKMLVEQTIARSSAPPPLWLTAWRRISKQNTEPLPPQRFVLNRLPFRRVLVLLTKVDQLAASTIEQIGRRDRFMSQQTAARLTSLMDPIECAREIVGVSSLRGLLSSMRPDANLAVALSSGGGFRSDTGTPLLDRQGRVNAASTTEREHLLSRWRPYGIREAIYFLASGRESGTLRVLKREHLQTGDRDGTKRIVPSIERKVYAGA